MPAHKDQVFEDWAGDVQFENVDVLWRAQP